MFWGFTGLKTKNFFNLFRWYSHRQQYKIRPTTQIWT